MPFEEKNEMFLSALSVCLLFSLYTVRWVFNQNSCIPSHMLQSCNTLLTFYPDPGSSARVKWSNLIFCYTKLTYHWTDFNQFCCISSQFATVMQHYINLFMLNSGAQGDRMRGFEVKVQWCNIDIQLFLDTLTLVLLSLDIPCFGNSVDPDQLASEEAN